MQELRSFLNLFYPISCSSSCIILDPEGSDPLISTCSLVPLFPAGPVPTGLLQDLSRGCLGKSSSSGAQVAAANAHSRSQPDCPLSWAPKSGLTHHTPQFRLWYIPSAASRSTVPSRSLSQKAQPSTATPQPSSAATARSEPWHCAQTLPGEPANSALSKLENSIVLFYAAMTISGREQRLSNNWDVQAVLLSTIAAAEATNSAGALLEKAGASSAQLCSKGAGEFSVKGLGAFQQTEFSGWKTPLDTPAGMPAADKGEEKGKGKTMSPGCKEMRSDTWTATRNETKEQSTFHLKKKENKTLHRWGTSAEIEELNKNTSD